MYTRIPQQNLYVASSNHETRIFACDNEQTAFYLFCGLFGRNKCYEATIDGTRKRYNYNPENTLLIHHVSIKPVEVIAVESLDNFNAIVGKTESLIYDDVEISNTILA